MKTSSYAAIVASLAVQSSCATVGKDVASRAEKASWTSLGCYTDNVSGRALPYAATTATTGGASGMTNEACQAACQAASYTMAGTEYGGECWCGNAVGSGGGPAQDGCNMPCNGKAAETCGGANRLTVSKLSSGGGGTAPPPASGTGKRGLPYNNNNPSKNAVYANMFKGFSKVSWAYDWGYPSWDLDSYFEFVPMLWGKPNGDAPDWTAAVQKAGTKNILAFNEPDLTYSGSANILPADAAAGYKTYMQPFVSKVQLGMPNVLWNNDVGSSSGGLYNSRVWTQYFRGNCTACHFDFAAIHYYQDCEPPGRPGAGPAWFQGNVTDAYKTLKLPIWVTEFQCYGSEDQQVRFLQNVLPWLDAQSYVARYAYFGTFPEHLITNDGTALSALGKAYAMT